MVYEIDQKLKTQIFELLVARENTPNECYEVLYLPIKTNYTIITACCFVSREDHEQLAHLTEEQQIKIIISAYGKNGSTFEIDPEIICAGGIHYFNNMYRTFYYRVRTFDYTGYWLDWNNNGQKELEGTYLNGTKTGKWIIWHNNGQKYCEGYYQDDNRTGNWTYWYEDGQKYQDDEYQGDEQSPVLFCLRAKNQGLIDYYQRHKLIGIGLFLAGLIYIFRKK
jgi:hypothetical protein